MHSALLSICLVVLLESLAPRVALARTPTIKQVQYQNAERAVIVGEGFEKSCEDCEVLVRYSHSLLYSAPIRGWQPTRIDIEIPDLNQNDALIQVQVKRGRAASPWKSFNLRRRIALLSSKTSTHSLSVGEKGEEEFTIRSIQTQCGKTVNVYDHSELTTTRKRFADARVVASPPSGCERCSPVVVRWYNEPTGYLSYEMRVFGRAVQGVCQSRVRNSSWLDE